MFFEIKACQTKLIVALDLQNIALNKKSVLKAVGFNTERTMGILATFILDVAYSKTGE